MVCYFSVYYLLLLLLLIINSLTLVYCATQFQTVKISKSFMEYFLSKDTTFILYENVTKVILS